MNQDKTYHGYNGDMSAMMVIIAPDMKTAKRLAKERINDEDNDEDLQSLFPVIDIVEIKEKGVVSVLRLESY